ncbi:VanZ family protein [Aquimarina sp. W85]|uniref:VanZ family protein n=1 Tax=Aquimarina rhodophyticola TaxID=3342246 RepID=UPI0036722437
MHIRNLLEHRNLFVLVLAATSVLTYLSLGTISSPISSLSNSDKIGHAIAYFVFTCIWFAFLYFSKKLKYSFLKSILYSAMICFGYGVLMEIAQGIFTTYRYVELFDVLANTSGIVIAVLFVFVLRLKIESI